MQCISIDKISLDSEIYGIKKYYNMMVNKMVIGIQIGVERFERDWKVITDRRP